jgi:hypothetical protein
MKKKTEHVGLGRKGGFTVKKGALHKMLHVPQGQKIPESKLKPHAGDSSLLRRRKASAAGLKAMHHGEHEPHKAVTSQEGRMHPSLHWK